VILCENTRTTLAIANPEYQGFFLIRDLVELFDRKISILKKQRKIL
jgi:hypothetical protein